MSTIVPQGAAPASASRSLTTDSSSQFPSGFVPDKRSYSNWRLQESVRDLLPSHPAADCCKHFAGMSGTVELNVQGSSSFVSGLAHCGSPSCPVCAPFKTRRVRRKLNLIVARARAKGFRVVMATYTFSHHAWDKLPGLLVAAAAAMSALRSGRFGDKFRKQYGVIGLTRNLEVPHGRNGWHPHYHELIILPADANVGEFRADLRAAWIAALAKQGLDASVERALDVTAVDEHIAAYVAKFGRMPKFSAGHEAAGGAFKRGRTGSRTLLDLLSGYTFDGDAKAGALWAEAAEALKGRPISYTSPGLLAALGITDEELEAAMEADDEPGAEEFGADRVAGLEAAADDDGKPVVRVLTLRAFEWRAVWYCRQVPRLLDLASSWVASDGVERASAECAAFVRVCVLHAIAEGWYAAEE